MKTKTKCTKVKSLKAWVLVKDGRIVQALDSSGEYALYPEVSSTKVEARVTLEDHDNEDITIRRCLITVE